MNALYRDHILDHGMNPRHRGLLVPADADFEAYNSLCGDRLRLTLRLSADRCITAVGWGYEGCAVSQAAASLLSEAVLGMTVTEVSRIGRQHILELLDIPLSANRVQCALLPLKVLTVALYGPDAWRRHEIEEDE
jgi:nitrogen fixation protein NifU and related proteins